jgi:hypothetical protein
MNAREARFLSYDFSVYKDDLYYEIQDHIRAAAIEHKHYCGYVFCKEKYPEEDVKKVIQNLSDYDGFTVELHDDNEFYLMKLSW